jgi:hypothetical protein
MVFRKVGVYENVVEADAFTLQCLEDEVMCWPESVFGERGSAQPVLIADHHQFEIGSFGQQAQPSEDAGLEAYLLQGVNLLVVGFLY